MTRINLSILYILSILIVDLNHQNQEMSMETEVIQSQCVKKLISFEPSTCNAELAKLKEEQWVQHVNRAKYDGQWSVIALRTVKQNEFSHPILQCYQIETGDDWVDLPILGSLQSIQALLNQIPFSKKSVRLMKLNAGAYIKEHQDRGLSIEHGEARFHIPLQCDARVTFVSDGNKLNMSEGELWYINAHAPHSVKNSGNNSRINLVVDCAVSIEQWRDFLEQDVGNAKH